MLRGFFTNNLSAKKYYVFICEVIIQLSRAQGGDFLTSKNISQIELSKRFGWTESKGRQWIKRFQRYLPFEENGIFKYYDEDAYTFLMKVKKLNDANISLNEIDRIFNEQGVPSSNEEIKNIIAETRKSFKIEHKILETMPVSKDLVIPILIVMSDEDLYIAATLNEGVANHFKLSENQINFAYPESKETVFVSRMRATRFSLQKKGYIQEVGKHTYKITQDGLELLNDSDIEIQDELEDLEQVVDPITVINEQIVELDKYLIEKILIELQKVHWRRFENIVVELLTAMGYGDGEVTQSTNDEGLDGIIKEDKLGLDNIYVQAKRWNNTVGRPEIMAFVGALEGKSASKGIFITTSSFSKSANEYVKFLPYKKVILIDGSKLARYMLDYNVGVTVQRKVLIKEVDFTYFEGE